MSGYEVHRELIRERVREFTGREWVFGAIDGWLRDVNGSRVFLLVGAPGTGKTAVAARLAEASFGEARIADCLALSAGFLDHVHFCQAGRDATLSPLTFVQQLSESLANRHRAFRRALEHHGSQQIVITSTICGSIAAGARVTGTQIGHITLQIRGGDARPLFDQLIRRPLQALCRAAPATSVRILVDSLDEALTFHPTESITQLLRLVGDFPPQVRFILTARSNESRVLNLVGARSLDLDQAPCDDVRAYAVARLRSQPALLHGTLAERIASRSHGNFLYAQHVLDELVGGKITTGALLDDLPDRLEEVYRRFLEREIASSNDGWRRIYRQLLGTIAVALGDGLRRDELAEITSLPRSTIDDALLVCKPYLDCGTRDDAPLRIYHHSFREFLLGDHPFGVYPAERHAEIARHLINRHGTDWAACDDVYALRYLPVHLAEAMRERTDRDLLHRLVRTVTDPAYQARCAEYLQDVPMLHAHVVRAITAVSRSNDRKVLPLLFRAAQGLSRLRDCFLRGDSVVALAKQGDAAKAEARLPLFDELDRDWQVAAVLIIAWLASGTSPREASALCARVRPAAQKEPLSLLLARVDAALHGDRTFAFQRNVAPPLEVAQGLVCRLSGRPFDGSLLAAAGLDLTFPDHQADPIRGHGYVASLDGPVLVATAREHGAEATGLLDEYIAAHVGYNYVQYRNRSLWMLLHAVLTHHPDQRWVSDRLQRILGAALEPGGGASTPMAPLFAAAFDSETLPDIVEGLRQNVIAAIGVLSARRGASDSWSIHRRRLIGLMEVEALVREDLDKARAEWKRIEDLEASKVLDGFAGFRAPAELRLADALRSCKIGDEKTIERCLDRAVRIAHRIQDYHFCARVTARCNTLRRWHRTSFDEPTLAATVERLVAAPDSAEFATDHVIGESYAHRDHTASEQLSVALATSACTLEALADVFQRPVIEFLRINPEPGLSAVLPTSTHVRVPDPGFVPLLAVHLAGRVLRDATNKNVRARALWSLTPIAARNSATLDSLLCYLLVAMKPDEATSSMILEFLEGLPTLGDAAPPSGYLGVARSDPA